MWGLGGCVGDWAGDGLGWGDKKFQSSAGFKKMPGSDQVRPHEKIQTCKKRPITYKEFELKFQKI